MASLAISFATTSAPTDGLRYPINSDRRQVHVEEFKNQRPEKRGQEPKSQGGEADREIEESKKGAKESCLERARFGGSCAQATGVGFQCERRLLSSIELCRH
ncbi:hypothetical protein [Pelagibius sp. Alg239-R121]|uniref:hypothetical protein n=1 Tax=Pelagibius sp. Alg239-R121 TaxID=2993448 RepID=UPI0024A75845|nr:hypothetical protein [Pelagibius sp. Alg239-R121]